VYDSSLAFNTMFVTQEGGPTTKPALKETSSSSSESSSTVASFVRRDSGVLDDRKRYGSDIGYDDDPIEEVRSEAGSCWSQHEQDQFISLILPYIHGKRLTHEEVQLIRSEAQQAHLPLECVDRLIEENERHYQRQQLKQSRVLSKQRKDSFDNIEDVDESDNIMAYFSRMATLKEGGHFPQLNTEAINSFVEEDVPATAAEDVEVDLDVGYVNKSFNSDANGFQPLNSWDDDNDTQCNISDEAFNRYDVWESIDPSDHLDPFESLLVGDAAPNRRPADGSDSVDDSGIVEDSLKDTEAKPRDQFFHPPTGEDWDPSPIRRTKSYPYGFGQELYEWKRKTSMALWHGSTSRSIAIIRSPFVACENMALATVADELKGFLFANRPTRLLAKKAVINMMARTKERRKRQQEMAMMCHVPDAHTPRPWQLPYRERCRAHAGYIGVDQYSLMDSAAPLHRLGSRDNAPWETRDVRQHFLHEQSVTLSKNWLGKCII
jgi:hypothetical protein